MDNYFSCLDRFVVSFGEKQGWSTIHINKVHILLMDEILKIVVSYDVGKYPVISKTYDIILDDYRKGLIIDPDPRRIFTRITPSKDISEYDESEQKIDSIFEAINYIKLDLESKGIHIPSYILDSAKIKMILRSIGDPRGSYYDKVKTLANKADLKILKRIESCNLEYIHPSILRNLENVQTISTLEQLVDTLKKSKEMES